jgi:hypothetical protein
MKIHIDYTKRGENHSDFNADSIIQEAIFRIKGTNQEIEIKTTNECVLIAAQVALKKKDILISEIYFYYEGCLLEHNKNGDFKYYPDGFMDIRTNLLMQLI